MADGGIGGEKAFGDGQVWGEGEFVPSREEVDGGTVAFTAFGEGSDVLCHVVNGSDGGSKSISGGFVEDGLGFQVTLDFFPGGSALA